ncbi:MAG: hypothetical protein ABL901_01070 [Hyphomicrobiaceae bacterium]
MSILEPVAMVLAEARALFAWRVMTIVRNLRAYAATHEVTVDGRVYASTRKPIDHMIDHASDSFADEVDMDGFAAWLRGHGIADVSKAGILALYWEYAQISGRRMASERSVFNTLDASGIQKYRPHLIIDGRNKKPTRYRVLPARPKQTAAPPGKTYRTIADVSAGLMQEAA